MSKTVMKPKKSIVLLFVFMAFFNRLYAQAALQDGYYWSLDAGYGTADILVKGLFHQFIVDPKLLLTPELMVGNKFGVGYSTDKILAFEEQVYLRWNFLHLGDPKKPVNVYLQGGIGTLAAYRGTETPFVDATKNRGSLLFDAAAGVTIPLGSRWHIEPSVRGGYPHIAGASITLGYKFPMPPEYGKLRSSNEIIKRLLIAGVDSITFGPDTEQYNASIDREAQEHNEAVLTSVAKTLKENPDFRVRIEGHANPVTNNSAETERLIALSMMRANTVAEMLKAKGVADEQMVVIALGGAKTITSDTWNVNRRVELIVIKINNNL